MVKKTAEKDTTENWEASAGQYARALIQIEMKKQKLGFRDLTERLNQKFKIEENERNVRNRVARGTFTAAFFLMCLMAMDCEKIEISGEPFSGFGLDLPC